MIQGYLGGGGAGEGWSNFSETIGDLGVLAGAPTRDTLAQWVSGSSDKTGTTLTVAGTAVGGPATPAYVGFYLGTFAALLPGLPLDGSAFMEMRCTVVTDAALGGDMYVGLGWGPDATLATGYMTPFYSSPAVNRTTGVLFGITYFEAAFVSAQKRRWSCPISTDGNFVGAVAAGTLASTSGMPGPNLVGNRRLALFCGTRSAPAAQQTCKLLWEIRGVSWT